MSVAIIDYGMGNLFSVAKALENIKVSFAIIQNPDQLALFDRALLPGVGAFVDGMANLRSGHWIEPIRAFSQIKPLLGICLGMQLLLEQGSEGVKTAGLGIIQGEVVRLGNSTVRLPHIGWNELTQKTNDPIFTNIQQGEDFYFVHSYQCQPSRKSVIIGTTSYGEEFSSVVKKDKVYGAQFHPEKSSTAGLQLLKNFCTVV